MKWIRKNWLLCLVILIAGIIIFLCLSSWISNARYKGPIEAKDEKIGLLENNIEKSEKEIRFLTEKVLEWQTKALEREVEIGKVERKIKVIKADRNKWREKVKEMPASGVVKETQEILKCEEIELQSQGIVFSLACAKKNLSVLGEFNLIDRENYKLREKYSLSQGIVSDLKNVILAKDGIIQEKDFQLKSKDEIIKSWSEKFDLCEKQKRKRFLKGFLQGGAIVGGIVLGVKLLVK